AAVAKGDDVTIVDAKTGRVIVDSRFAQQKGKPLGRPSDRRFASLVSANAVAGSDTVSGHRVAYRRLTETDTNANDWYDVAVNRKPVRPPPDGAGPAPPGLAAAAPAPLRLSGPTSR